MDTLKLLNIWLNTAQMFNVQDKWDWTALINASHNGHLEIVKYLVVNGADVSIKNNNDETALDKAETDEIKKY